MFCKNCGQEIKEGVAFCPNCGNKIEKKVNIPSYKKGKFNGSGKNINKIKKKKISAKKKKKIKIITGVVAFIAIVAAIAVYAYNMDYKHIVNACVKASFSNKGDSVEKTYKLLPEESREALLNNYKEENKGADEEEMMEEMQKEYDDLLDMLDEEYGENWKYSFDIKKVEDGSRKEIREWKQNIKDSKVKFDREVKGMKKVTIKIRMQSEDGEKNDKTDMTIVVVRLGYKWYIGKGTV